MFFHECYWEKTLRIIQEKEGMYHSLRSLESFSMWIFCHLCSQSVAFHCNHTTLLLKVMKVAYKVRGPTMGTSHSTNISGCWFDSEISSSSLQQVIWTRMIVIFSFWIGVEMHHVNFEKFNLKNHLLLKHSHRPSHFYLLVLDLTWRLYFEHIV